MTHTQIHQLKLTVLGHSLESNNSNGETYNKGQHAREKETLDVHHHEKALNAIIMSSFFSKGFIRKAIVRKTVYVAASELISNRPRQSSVSKSMTFSIDKRIIQTLGKHSL